MKDPIGSNARDWRVLRGGSWVETSPDDVRTARRKSYDFIIDAKGHGAVVRHPDVGFRCASVPGADTVKPPVPSPEPPVPSAKPFVKPLPKSPKEDKDRDKRDKPAAPGEPSPKKK